MPGISRFLHGFAFHGGKSVFVFLDFPANAVQKACLPGRRMLAHEIDEGKIRRENDAKDIVSHDVAFPDARPTTPAASLIIRAIYGVKPENHSSSPSFMTRTRCPKPMSSATSPSPI